MLIGFMSYLCFSCTEVVDTLLILYTLTCLVIVYVVGGNGVGVAGPVFGGLLPLRILLPGRRRGGTHQQGGHSASLVSLV